MCVKTEQAIAKSKLPSENGKRKAAPLIAPPDCDLLREHLPTRSESSTIAVQAAAGTTQSVRAQHRTLHNDLQGSDTPRTHAITARSHSLSPTLANPPAGRKDRQSH